MLQDKPILKKFLIGFLYLSVPVFIAGVIHLMFHISMPLVCTILFGILVFVLLPSDNYLSTVTDYETKRINPGYRPENKKLRRLNWTELIYFALAGIGLVVSLIFLTS